MIDALDSFTATVGESIGKRAAEVFMAELRKHTVAPAPDPLLTVAEIATELKVSKPIVYRLIEQGYIKKAPGMDVVRARQSVVREYGKANPKNK